MSAIRHDRRGLRAVQASPYARPAKKSPWSFSTLFNFLNPLRLGSWNDDSASEGSNEGLPISSASTDGEDFSQSTSNQPLHNIMQPDPKHSQRPLDPPRDRRFQPPMKTTSPTKQSITAALRLGDIDDSCPTKNIEIVTKFLEERGGNPMSSVELEGVISLLRKSAQPEKHEPFRFSFSISPTPGRSDSPDTVGGHITSNNETTQPPRKMMKKNPNGVYRWRGGGSARPARSRNRYASPAFGPSRSVPDRLILKDNPVAGEGGRTDNKRRRIDDDVTSSPPTKLPPRVNGLTAAQPASDTSNTISPHNTTSRQVNGLSAQLKVNGTSNSTSISLRAPGLPKPTTPAVPSPLRQAWSGSSSDVSTNPMQTPPTPPKPTKAANLMAELIKEATPPKKPDVSNPYQTASPVKITPSASKPRPKRTRPSKSTQMEGTKTAVDGEMKSDETRDKITPQAIIEATLPKGSKRARPPAHFEKPANSEAIPIVESTREDTQLSSTKERRTEAPYIVEEVDEDEDARSRVSKKPKPYLNGRGTPSERRDIPIVEEVVDVEMNGVNENPAPRIAPPPISPVTAAPAKGIFSHKPSSIPKEPSKLRFSYQPENPASEAPSPPPPEVASETASETKADPLPIQMAVANAPDPKATAHALPTSSLPVFTFAFAAISTIVPSSDEKLAREQAISRAESSLPRFSFISRPENNPPAPTVSPVPVQTFNWSAVGIKPPPAAGTGGNWTCSTCDLSNPPSAVEKCTICDTPR